MSKKKFTYEWHWTLESTPEQFWKYIADTNRFNFDTGVPPVTRLSVERTGGLARQKLKLTRIGFPVIWEEEPFEWIYPYKYGVRRIYSTGPLSEMDVNIEMSRSGSGKTDLKYVVKAAPSNILGYIAIPLQVGYLSAKYFDKAIRKYDKTITEEKTFFRLSIFEKSNTVNSNLDKLCDQLILQTNEREIVHILKETIKSTDDLTLSKMQPYRLAKHWNTDPKKTLEVFLYATRAGILDLSWDILCPMCRGTQYSIKDLKEIETPVHCESCNFDFNVNFEQLVEITFRPNPAIRKIEIAAYCVGGPQVTSHIVAQQILKKGEIKIINPILEEGAYRIRTSQFPNGQFIKVSKDGGKEYDVTVETHGFAITEINLFSSPALRFINHTGSDQLFIFERMSWADDVVTAREVTAMQTFRDIFASEAIRQGEQISVGRMAILFTDLKNSTQLYRNIGDATAFGYVMDHFSILRKAIRENEGALVKTIGDAVMAVFVQPASAIKAMLEAQRLLMSVQYGNENLLLKVGIHYGPCIAVNLNNTLDYFGSTINLAARLEGLSSGKEIVISQAVYDDQGVQDFLKSNEKELGLENFATKLKGFENESFELLKVFARKG